MSTSRPDYRYWAFISYSSKDADVARRLHRRLETYRIPRDLVGRPGRDEPVPRRLFPVFRDRDELPLSADLGASIEDALRASRYLIVLCSPAAAASRWVNEEVRYFKSLGREDRILAVIVDGEPNASDDPATTGRECFPPALRHRLGADGRLTAERTEPVAGDLRPQGDGWTGAFLKAVAGITGLGFDAFARRERKRRRRRVALAGAFGILALGGGLWGWDYNRVKVEHYANVATRWGVPEGVGRLDERTRERREIHYRIESRRYRVRQVFRLNGAGQLRADDENHGAAVQQVFYREDGTVQRIDLRDHNHRLVVRQTFSELRDGPEGQIHYLEFRHEHRDAPLALGSAADAYQMGLDERGERSDITGHEVLYDDLGRAARVVFLNPFRQNRPTPDGVFGHRFHYEGDGALPARVEYLGFDGRPLPDRYGVSAVSIARGPRGDLTETRHLGPDGSPATHPRGFHRVVEARDDAGNATGVAYFGIDDQPVPNEQGYHRIAKTHDERGNVTSIAFFGVDGPLRVWEGYHRVEQEFDERGNLVAQAAFDPDGEPALYRGGFHRVTQAFDDRGNIIEVAYHDLAGPASLLEGYHRFTRTFDERGNLVEQAVFGIDGEPASYFGYYHLVRREYDDRDNPVAVSYFDVGGLPAADRDGHHRVTQAFDERGNLVEVAYHVVDSPAFTWDGYHRVAQAFDERGNVREVSYFGPGGPVLVRDGYHRATQSFDERGNPVELAYFGTRGEPALRRDRDPLTGLAAGYHRHVRAFDERGHAIEEAYFDVDGLPTLHWYGHHRVTRSFDARGNKVEEAFHGVDGGPAPYRQFVRFEIEYDDAGNETRRVAWRADGTFSVSEP